MKRFVRYLLCVLMLAAICTAGVFAATDGDDDPSLTYVKQTAPYEDAGIKLWFDHSFRKNFTSDKKPTGKDTYSIYMAKNEKESAQFVLYSDTDRTGMKATLTDFTDENGNTVQAEIMYEMYVTTSNLALDTVYGATASNPLIREGETPDPVAPLKNVKTFKLNGGKSQAFLIKATTDKNSVPGWYSAQLDVKDSEDRVVKTATVYLRVWDITVPTEPTLQTGIFLTNDVSFGGTYEQFYNYLLDNRMNAMDIPGELNSSNPYLTDPRVNSVRVMAHGGGNNKIYMDPVQEYRYYKDIYDELHTSDIWDDIKDKLYFYTSDEPAPAGVSWTGWDVDNTVAAAIILRSNWPDPNIVVPHHENTPYPNYYFSSNLSNYPVAQLRDSNEEFIDKEAVTWWCPMLYAFTPSGQISSSGGLLRDLDGGHSGTYYSGQTAHSGFFDWDPIYGSFYDRTMSEIALKRAEGKDYRMWAYCCSTGGGYTYCNHLIENTGLQTKLMFWQMYQNDVTGYLYYASNNWSDYGAYIDKTVTGAKNTAWYTNRVSHNGRNYIYGDGILFYGQSQGRVSGVDCIGSIRAEIMRDGIEEYEMLKLLEEEKGKSYAKSLVNEVSKSVSYYISVPTYRKSGWKSGMDDYDIMETIHVRLGNELEAALASPCEHTYNNGVVTTSAGCTKAGYKTYTCTKCGAKYEELIPTLHSVGDCFEKVAGTYATCTADGNYRLRCVKCGYEKNMTEPSHHGNPEYFEYNDKSESVHEVVCRECGVVLTNEGHRFFTEYTNTCTEDGEIIKFCRYCNRSYSEGSVSAKGHKLSEISTEPTCTEDGYTRTVCDRCDEVFEENTVPATGHNYVNGFCTVCGEEEPRPLYTLGDLNGDGEITAIDSNLMKKHISGNSVLEGAYSLAADVNGDNEITAIDANLMTKYLAGAITVFPAN